MLLILLFAACNRDHDAADHADVYTCPMHPTVVSDKPGACPVCGMDLVKKAKPGAEVKITEDLSRLLKPPTQSVVSSIETINPSFKSLSVSVDALGIITYDTRNIFTISARVGGRIEKMFLKYEFQKVRKGQKIAEIYSPELVTAQRELLYLMQHDSTNSVLIEAARRKLDLLGVSGTGQSDLLKQRQPPSVFGVYSPYDGYVIFNERAPASSVNIQQPSSSTSQMNGMGGSSTIASSTTTDKSTDGELPREGSYVNAGQMLVKIVNTNALRVELDLPLARTGTINVGDKVDLRFGNGRTTAATVDFVEPFVNENQNLLKLRVYLDNAEGLTIGGFVRGSIRIKSKESLWIPKTAVLDLGDSKIAFVKDRDVLKPVHIKIGIQASDSIEVTNGLATSDDVALNAQYLVDSESFIKPVR